MTPDKILQLGFGFWSSRTLLTAVELGLFTHLAKGPMGLDELRRELGLHPRSARDFLDALVALGMLEREGEADRSTYRNTPETDLFLDKSKPTYVGGMLEMCARRLYAYWGDLTEGLRTGLPQNEIKTGKGGGLFDEIYSSPEALRGFLAAMTGLSLGAARAIAEKFPWRERRTFLDIGAAQGAVPVQLALAHPHLRGGNFDLPQVGPIFDDYVRQHGLSDRLKFHGGDFFKDPLPPAEVYIMGHILHDWNLDEKKVLLKKCFDALPAGGALIVYEALIDDARRTNAFGLLMSLNMLIETPGGFDFTGADCSAWMKEIGFRSTRTEHLAGPDSMVVGVK
jgi:hypothetical protein